MLDEGEWLGFRSELFNPGMGAGPDSAEGGLGTAVIQPVGQ